MSNLEHHISRITTYNSIINRCSSLSVLQCLHGRILVDVGGSCNTSDFSHGLIPLTTKLISLASFLGPSMDYARSLFDRVPIKEPVAWNAVIRGYAVKGPCLEALHLYRRMRRAGLFPDQSTYPFLVRSCSVICSPYKGKQMHCDIVKHGLYADFYNQTALVSMYSQIAEVRDAEIIFEQMVVKNIVSWTAMISGYAQNGLHHMSLRVFKSMICSGMHPNSITFVSILPSCACSGLLYLGQSIHGFATKSGFDAHLNLMNAVIAMYGKFGLIEDAELIFHATRYRNLASWNAIISAYKQNGHYKKAVEIFDRMLRSKVAINHITAVSMISVCASLGELDVARWVYDVAKVQGFGYHESVLNSLLEAYAKCGDVKSATKVFDELPEKNVISWTAMIGAYSVLGHATEALELFSRMIDSGIQPNGSTFTALLSACGRAGLLEEGKNYYEIMIRDYGVIPSIEHYTCVVDLLSRAGRLAEALEFVQDIPIDLDIGTWGALLNGCMIHGKLELAEAVAKQLFMLDSQSDTCYVLMMNIYADAGKWDDVERLEMTMKNRRLTKVPGCSLVR